MSQLAKILSTAYTVLFSDLKPAPAVQVDEQGDNRYVVTLKGPADVIKKAFAKLVPEPGVVTNPVLTDHTIGLTVVDPIITDGENQALTITQTLYSR